MIVKWKKKSDSKGGGFKNRYEAGEYTYGYTYIDMYICIDMPHIHKYVC